MALFDYTAGELIAKVVYYGPDAAGKTTNLRRIHERLPAGSKGELAIVTTPTGNTLVFDFLPPDTGRAGGLRMRFQLCALSGSGPSLAARRGVLKGADAVVFVADSQAKALDAVEQSLDGLYRNLPRGAGDSAAPIVIQYNKRDLATALPLEALNKKLNPRGLPSLEAIAIQGIGVDETLRVVLRLCTRAVAALHGEGEAATPGSASVDRTRTEKVKLELPFSPAGRPAAPKTTPTTAAGRVQTPQSLARESLELPPNPDTSRATTLRFDKNEVLGTPRGDAESTKALPKVRLKGE